jgi:hypothetical protein
VVNDGVLHPDVGRYGEPVAGGGVSFRCAACGEVAAVVRLVRAGTPVNMGPPLGPETYERGGVVVDYWLGTTSWRRLDAVEKARVAQVLQPTGPTRRSCARSTGNWGLTGAGTASAATAATTGRRPLSGTAPSTTTPTVSAQPGTAT